MRQRAALVIIVIAGLASAATSASTPPPPDVVGGATGEILLTPEQPIGAVELVVGGNVAAGSTTSFSVTPESSVPEDGRAPGVSSVVFQVIAGGGGSSPWSDQLYGTFPVSCTSGLCDGRFTLRALLTDPSDGAQRVTWRATVETRNPAGVAPASDAALTIDADPVAVAADTMALATAAFDRVTVSRDHPRSVHTVRFDAPFGPREGDLVAGSLLRITGTASDGASPAPFRMLFQTQADGAYEMPVNASTLYDPFHACFELLRCVGEYQVIFEWSGGPVEREAIIEADLSAWLPRPEDATADAVLDLSVASEPDRPGAVVRASLSGVFEIDRDASQGAVVDAVLDQQAVPQGITTAGVALATLRTRVVDMDPATGDPPIGDINVRLGVDGVSLSQDSFGKMAFVVGETETIGSSVVVVACQGRSKCPFAFELSVGKPIDAERKIRVEWVLDVELTLADGAELDPGAKLALEVRPDP